MKLQNYRLSEAGEGDVDFQTHPDRYNHWQLSLNGATATLSMQVNPDKGMFEGYELKMNSYDLGVDIELNDAIQRLRFEHPEVHSVVINSAQDRIFCAGANIKMLGVSSHPFKVNFCKFTNETRNSIEDASLNSQQKYLCAINGTAAGGGYELALATESIVMVDDGNAAVSLPEVPLLAVLPGTGGLTRVVDKRKVRRDLADVFCTSEEGARGQKAVKWRLVDEVVKGSKFDDRVSEIAKELAKGSDRPADEKGVLFSRLERKFSPNMIEYNHLGVELDLENRIAYLTLKTSGSSVPDGLENLKSQGQNFWPLALCRELEDAILHLRTNHLEIGTLIFESEGDLEKVTQYDQLMRENKEDWLVREVLLYWQRTLKRVDLTSRTTFAFVTPGSCFSGFLSEILFAMDRVYMLDGPFDGESEEAQINLTESNFGLLKMSNGITRLETRFLGEPKAVTTAYNHKDFPLKAEFADSLGLTTYIPDDIDWEDEIRQLIEERSSFSPDSLTGMEANLRFAGPETMETKIFGRLTAWQNWIFQRPNAVSETGALKLYGTGDRPKYDQRRV
ncbi:MAG: benzoyl-CoA-dihydrodiol lyase [Proteobacteria bacterium]|nr:benzoyl-CoA-dihydrodiol lyase [Pseudomonadota bacterium]